MTIQFFRRRNPVIGRIRGGSASYRVADKEMSIRLGNRPSSFETRGGTVERGRCLRIFKGGSNPCMCGLALGSLIFFMVLSLLVPGVHADNAAVLPKGIWNATVNPQIYLPVTEKFDNSGHVVPVAQDYNTNLNSNIFTGLKLIEKAFHMAPGSASLGVSKVKFDYDFLLFDFLAAYGVTDRLTIGIKIPYWRVTNHVTADLVTTHATIGKNAHVPGGLAPLSVPGTVPLTAKDVIKLLTSQYGYKGFGSWSSEGLSDMDVGIKYQYFRNKDWQLASVLALQAPTGQIADQDILTSYAFGTGNWGLMFGLNNDCLAIRRLLLDATFRSYIFFPSDYTLRISPAVHQPITNIKETVQVQTGDIFEFEVSAKYQLTSVIYPWVLYKYGFGMEKSVTDQAGNHIESLEGETDYEEHVGMIGLCFSTIPLFQAKEFPVPLTADIYYRNRFAGRNTLKSQYIGVVLSVYF